MITTKQAVDDVTSTSEPEHFKNAHHPDPGDQFRKNPSSVPPLKSFTGFGTTVIRTTRSEIWGSSTVHEQHPVTTLSQATVSVSQHNTKFATVAPTTIFPLSSSSSIPVVSTPLFQRKGVVAGISVAIGATITSLIITVIILFRRLRRARLEAKTATEESETSEGPSTDLMKDREGSTRGGGAARLGVAVDAEPFNTTSESMRIQSMEHGTIDMVEDFLSSLNHGDESLGSGLGSPGPENDARSEQGGDEWGRYPADGGAYSERTSRRNSRVSSRSSSRHSYITLPEQNEEGLVFPMPPETEGWSFRREPTDSSSLTWNNESRGHTTSTKSERPASIVSEYPTSTYPTSALPAYPDTIRSVSPPPDYYDLSRTQTLRSAPSFRSAYDPHYWSRGDVPSMPSPWDRSSQDRTM